MATQSSSPPSSADDKPQDPGLISLHCFKEKKRNGN
uniref:Uncharacterized protein n=1 Tax=Rhizophora mucronata TaxID=61149 RepID=A0A2P2K1F6_RHIMU